MKRLALIAVAAAIVMTAHVRAMISEQVKIESGVLAGTTSDEPKGYGAEQKPSPAVRVFKGIPFAAPPLGENRWKAPQPVAKWDGVRSATAFGAPCTAGAPFPGRGGARGAAPGQAPAAPAPPREPARSEDCL